MTICEQFIVIFVHLSMFLLGSNQNVSMHSMNQWKRMQFHYKLIQCCCVSIFDSLNLLIVLWVTFSMMKLTFSQVDKMLGVFFNKPYKYGKTELFKFESFYDLKLHRPYIYSLYCYAVASILLWNNWITCILSSI